jgi:toxin ParE1/3/4
MSARKKPVVLSVDAEVDLNNILLFTWQQWGDEQRDRYEAALQRVIAALTDFPEIGARMPWVFPDCRARPVERHVLYYRVTDAEIEVVRILHERVDPTRHFQP